MEDFEERLEAERKAAARRAINDWGVEGYRTAIITSDRCFYTNSVLAIRS